MNRRRPAHRPPARWQLAATYEAMAPADRAEVARRARRLSATHTKHAAWGVAMCQVRRETAR